VRRRREVERVEPPGWVAEFVEEDWAQPWDYTDPERHPAGAPLTPREAAYGRWLEATREWWNASGLSFVDYLAARRAARLKAAGIEDGAGGRRRRRD